MKGTLLRAAGPGKNVPTAKRRYQPPRKGDEQLIASDTAHAFVDAAEAEHVHYEDRLFRFARDPGTRDFNLDQLRGGDVTPEALASILATPPMMAGNCTSPFFVMDLRARWRPTEHWGLALGLAAPVLTGVR